MRLYHSYLPFAATGVREPGRIGTTITTRMNETPCFVLLCQTSKDRGASVLLTKARELGVAFVVEDSSGNAGGAFAAENTAMTPITGSGTKSAQQILGLKT